MKRLVLGIQYDGADWQGWQTQSHRETVQDVLEAALFKFTNRRLQTHCAGRTDAGVHALEQVVHFDTTLDRNMHSWISALNSFLPASVAVQWVHEVPFENPDADDNFHARFSAYARTYHYVLANRPIRSPVLGGRVGWVFRPLDVECMRVAAQALLGENDFSVFRASSCQAKSPIKHMYEVNIQEHGGLIVLTLRGNAFLHHMVRNIVGSLIFVGMGRRGTDWIAELLRSKDRSLAAPTFTPDGLYLANVSYDLKWNLPQIQKEIQPWFLIGANS